jgi:hypothetical protein
MDQKSQNERSKKMNAYSFKVFNESPLIRDGENFVLSVIMMKEGVHVGSHGPVFWPAHVLNRAARDWEGIPACLGHPKDETGRFVAVEFAPSSVIGRVTKPRFDFNGRALKAKVVIPASHPKAAYIQGLREVSVGVFGNENLSAGSWRGERFEKIATEMLPDHLAILPIGDEGACSWSDGCGLRVNQETIEVYKQALDQLLKEAGINQNKNVLLPAGYQREEKIISEELKRFQDDADKAGVLLPCEMNVLIGRGPGRNGIIFK